MTAKTNEDQKGIRLFKRDKDIPGLVQLRIDIEAFDHAGTDLTESAVIETLNWLGHDPEKDRWVIDAPEPPTRLIGYAWAFVQSQERTVIFAAIHPEWRRKGLGSELLSLAIARAREHGASHVTAAVNAKNKAAGEFLLRNGFRHAGNNRFMQAPTGVVIPKAAWPAGYTVRSYAEVKEPSILVEAFNRSYGDMWGHMENTKGAMNEAFLAGLMKSYPDQFIPEGIFIAFSPDGDIAGVCVAKLGVKVKGLEGEREKIVDSPGIAPAYRPMGLLRPLTLTAMQWLQGLGAGPIQLETYGDGEAAAEIYGEVGFVMQEHYVEYCRYLS
jgi:GNAT superfamily N-acetyltransferase